MATGEYYAVAYVNSRFNLGYVEARAVKAEALIAHKPEHFLHDEGFNAWIVLPDAFAGDPLGHFPISRFDILTHNWELEVASQHAARKQEFLLKSLGPPK